MSHVSTACPLCPEIVAGLLTMAFLSERHHPFTMSLTLLSSRQVPADRCLRVVRRMSAGGALPGIFCNRQPASSISARACSGA